MISCNSLPCTCGGCTPRNDAAVKSFISNCLRRSVEGTVGQASGKEAAIETLKEAVKECVTGLHERRLIPTFRNLKVTVSEEDPTAFVISVELPFGVIEVMSSETGEWLKNQSPTKQDFIELKKLIERHPIRGARSDS